MRVKDVFFLHANLSCLWKSDGTRNQCPSGSGDSTYPSVGVLASVPAVG